MSDCLKAINRPKKIRHLQRTLYIKAKSDKDLKFHNLYDKVYRRDVLWQAWIQVKMNGGAPGVDGKRIKEVVERKEEEMMIEKLHQLLKDKRYKFSAVRQVDIPKPKGGTRPLGIGTIEDRVVQTAVKIVIEPLYECDFHDCSYGYRPQRNAQMAVKRITKDLYNKAWGVVEIDLKSYFTTIPHKELMQKISKRITDKALLKIIKHSLEVPVFYKGKTTKTTVGVPQGSPLSPLYSNIYLNELDHKWHEAKFPERLGATIHRYADDVVIVCRKSGKVALNCFMGLATQMKLQVNLEKTKITELKEGFDFIGFKFIKKKSWKTQGSLILVSPSKSSEQNLKNNLKNVTKRRAPLKPEEFIRKINAKLRGWINYYKYVNAAKAFRRLQEFINNRLRRYLSYRSKKRGFGFNLYPKELLYKMGLIQIHSGVVCRR